MKKNIPNNPHRLLFLATGFWMLLAVTGSLVLIAYTNTAGAAADVAGQIPKILAERTSAGRYTLFMFVHPKCPCSRSSISELARLMTACSKRLDTHVLFSHPAGKPSGWSQTGLWESASRISGVSVSQDIDGRTARSVQAATSGQVLLYDAQGKLVFQGGITAGRGHEGDNLGRTAIEDCVMRNQDSRSATPVFGCSIFGPQATSGNPGKGRTK